MIVVIATVQMEQGVTAQVHVPMDMQISGFPPTEEEMEMISEDVEKLTGYTVISIDSLSWAP